ncbi:hypothetical protein ACSSS7_004901 [Eimeria intestinalis]
MKLLVAWASLALTGLQPAESGAGQQPWQWKNKPGQPGGQPSGQQQVPAWWQGMPPNQRQPAGLPQLPSAPGAPYQQLGGGFPQFPNLQGSAQMPQKPGLPAPPFIQQPSGVPAAPPLQQLPGVPPSASIQQLSGLPQMGSVHHYGGGAAGSQALQLPAAPGGSALSQLGSGGSRSFPAGLMHDDIELVQQRKRVPAGGVGAPGSLGTSGGGTFGQAAGGGTWRDSNTFIAVQELHAQVVRLFQRQGGEAGWAYGGSEVAVPVENFTNVLMELSKLIPAVIVFCETERLQKGSPQVNAFQAGGMHATNRNTSFPADQFVLQGMNYATKVTAQLRALRDLLTSVVSPSATKESLAPEIQRFRAATADLKDAYQMGSQVASAAVGAVLPYVSTCSFFVKGDSDSNYKLWSVMGARFSSTLRYIYHVLAAVRSASSKLGELVSGEVQPRSLLDFSRLRPLSKAASHLKTAEARSASAVRYFNNLAAAYKQHIQQAQGEGGSDLQQRRIGDDTDDEEKFPLEDDEVDRADFSLLADDLSVESEMPHPPGVQEDEQAAALQTAQEEGRPSLALQHGEDSEDEDERLLQTVEGD